LWQVKEELPSRRLEHQFAELRKHAEKDFQTENWTSALEFRRTVDVRYRGQGYELNVAFSPQLLLDFHKEHERRYGYKHPDREVELVTLRLHARAKSPQVQPGHNRKKNATARGMRARVGFGGKLIITEIYNRENLPLGKRLSGPAVVTEYSATTVVPPHMHFALDKASNLIIGD
jgi:N-methylhydantoinase A